LAKVMEGTISGLISKPKDTSESKPTPSPVNATHWSLTANILEGEFIIQSAQHVGISGAAVSNGCGYLGMLHAVWSEGFAVFAAIVPAAAIMSFLDDIIRENPHKLKTASQCYPSFNPRKVVAFPISPFMNCIPSRVGPSSVSSSDARVAAEINAPGGEPAAVTPMPLGECTVGECTAAS